MLYLWGAFLLLVVVLLALDLGVFHKKAHEISIKEAMGWTIFWVTIGLSFSGVIFLIYEYHWLGAGIVGTGDSALKGEGGEAVLLYLTGYLLEKSLSLDNIFVIALIFTSFQVRDQFQHRVLFWGILGALIMRGAMIGGGIWLVEHFDWIFYVFGAYLVYAGIKILIEKEETVDLESKRSIRFFRRILPLTTKDYGDHFLVVENGKRVFTKLILALITIELTDVLFAVDSVPAVLAVTTEPFIVVTSNVFAILGLRSLYFVLAGMLRAFHYLKIALSLLLMYIGIKMLLFKIVHIPTLLSLSVIVGLVTGGIVLSLVSGRKTKQKT